MGDGRFLLILTGIILILSGAFVIAQSLSGHFLPHDVNYLGLDATALSTFNKGTITKFMFHDRISFGGSIIAVGLLYAWLAEFPLKSREPWAWYLFLFSGIIGFGSFLTYLGYGYFDSWHGVATLLLLVVFIAGLSKSYSTIKSNRTFQNIFVQKEKIKIKSIYSIGKVLLLFSAIGMFLAGMTIMIVGMTTVFVPQDLAYMEITVCGIQEINANLKPLIAHDRAAFGGGLATIGLLYFFIIRCADPTVNLWEMLLVSMVVGFTTAIGVHFMIGYTDVTHLFPAYCGAIISVVGLVLTCKRMRSKEADLVTI